ncbi:Hypothetical protein GLP15_2578 [Giardia lamblia P15]|uniref:Uncharacterized protein n=1 Tax=Giardia intestinalis (strain P15) TaxID=658858 RepID=E1EXP7_GIAIA|nr:Hypothetical protein GLP15_2578 [Giardia lamblia P15]
MSVKALSDGVQELLSSPLLTERHVSEILDPILRKRPSLVLLVFSLLIRRLLLPDIGLDAHNIALLYSFCLDRTHVGIFEGLSLALETHATLLLRCVIVEGKLRFENQIHSVHALVQHKGALSIIFKTLALTPWLSKEDVAILVQTPIIRHLRAKERCFCRQEHFTKQTNFITASKLIINIIQQRYLLLRSRYSVILYSIMQNYDTLFNSIESTAHASLFQKYLYTLQAERSSANENFAQLGPYFKWRHYRDQILAAATRERSQDQPTVIKTVMISIRGFAEHSRTSNSNFTLIYNTFLKQMLRISSDTIPLENELKKQEEIIETLLSNNIRAATIPLPINTLKQCHDMLVLAGLIRQDVLNCSGTVLFLLGVSYGME